jgi:hypothetical protein
VLADLVALTVATRVTDEPCVVFVVEADKEVVVVAAAALTVTCTAFEADAAKLLVPT